MERRSPPQKRIDDHAFPVRVKVLVPERGFENLLLDMHRWLDAEVGRGSYAEHGARTGLTDATAWYFRSVEAAQAFVARFPMLELADGTELPTYQSPYLPFGRGAEWSDPVCNLYSMLKSQEAMRRLFDGLIDRAGNMPPLPGHLSRLQRADHPQRTGRPRARHGALGHADAAAVPGRQEGRPRRHQHPADDLVALAGLARTRASLPRALHQLRRERGAARRQQAAGLVRLRREPAARLLRRHLGDLDLGAEGQGGAGPRRPLRVPDLGAERRGRGGPSEGDAGDPDRARRVGDAPGYTRTQPRSGACSSRSSAARGSPAVRRAARAAGQARSGCRCRSSRSWWSRSAPITSPASTCATGRDCFDGGPTNRPELHHGPDQVRAPA